MCSTLFPIYDRTIMSSTLLFLIASIAITVTAQLFLKKGVLKLGQISFSSADFLGTISQAAQNIWIMAGLFLFGVGFFLWIFILSRFQLNLAYPIVVSLNFIFIAIGSWLLFQEDLSPLQIFGILIIIIGVLFVFPKEI